MSTVKSVFKYYDVANDQSLFWRKITTGVTWPSYLSEAQKTLNGKNPG